MEFSAIDLGSTIPMAIGDFSLLESLVCFGCNLHGTIPANLPGHLSNLILVNNSLSGPIPSSLGSLVYLVGLGLVENELTGTIPANLAKLGNLKEIGLWGNRLTGLVPELPFAQYRYMWQPAINGKCCLSLPSECVEPNCNKFKCPLPPGSSSCTTDTNPPAGVDCV
jgi:hypothetical protein